MNDVKVLANMQHLSTVSILNPLSAFPDPPINDSVVLVNGVVYAYTLIGASRTWYPLTNKSEYVVYTQSTPALVWDIQHNFGTKNIIFFAYDNDDVLQLPAIKYVNSEEENHIQLVFTEAISGRAVIFAASNAYGGGGVGTASTYVLPSATDTILGGVTVGANINVDNGKLSIPLATTNVVGVAKPGDGLLVDEAGAMSVDSTKFFAEWNYSTRTASSLLVNRDFVYYDTTNGACTATLPAAPADNSRIFIIDPAGKFSTNNLTLACNSNPIRGIVEDINFDINYAANMLIWQGATYGWQIVSFN